MSRGEFGDRIGDVIIEGKSWVKVRRGSEWGLGRC